MTQAMLRPLPERASTPALDDAPPAIGGKFFFVGDHKLYLRGVSYGPFAVSGHGFPFPDPPTLEPTSAPWRNSGWNGSAPSPCRRVGSSTAPPSTGCAC